MSTKARILAVCAAAVLTVPALGACGTYHDTYHDAGTYHDTYHDACDPARASGADAGDTPGCGDD